MNTSHIQDKLIALLNQSVEACELTSVQACERFADLIGDARIVLMGESSHGTMEFYQMRMLLSEYLIQKKGFQAIAIEGDWTSVYPIHTYLQGKGDPEKPEKALEQFMRFPAWMWRNTLMPAFLKKIRRYNVGFYGLDLYCLNEAMQAVINYLKDYHPEAAQNAIRRYACFDHAHVDPQAYGYLLEQHVKQSCVKEVCDQLLEMQRLAYQNIQHNIHDQELQFYALQNARVVKNAENYYRALFEPHNISWNIRDHHMVDTLQNIIAHYETISQQPAKIIVWAHNSHVGDARATEMSEQQEVNLGQLVRERFDTASFLLGFSTAIGKVTAASHWDGPCYEKTVQPPIHGSYEWLFHQLESKNFILNLRDKSSLMHLLSSPQLLRAIGVIYLPETERMSHYFFSRLPLQFDALIHFDQTQALIPLSR